MKNNFALFRPLKQISKLVYMIYHAARRRIFFSIRVELYLSFLISLVLSVILVNIVTMSMRTAVKNTRYSLEGIDPVAQKIALEVLEEKETGLSDYEIQKLINQAVARRPFTILITDNNGKVLYKSVNAKETQIDLFTVFKNDIDDAHHYQFGEKKFFCVYPTVLKKVGVYVIGYMNTNDKAVVFVGVILFITIAFIGLFFFLLLTKRKIKYIEKLVAGISTIATGNLDFRIEKKGMDELALLAGNINKMAAELKYQIEEERKTERTKNELITNISHDLRTPLTSIMGYLRLLSGKKYVNERQLEDFINIAYDKSDKLNMLIKDLFDYTKLSNEGTVLNISKVNINEMLEQLIEELTPVAEENELQFMKEISQDKIVLEVDGDLLVRVFENLLMNAIRYSFKPGKILIKLLSESGKALICIENKGAHIPSEELPNLFNRFYRLEKSRSADSGGSGLGLAIAKSIVSLHHGAIWAECEDNNIRFVVELPLDNYWRLGNK